MSLLYFAKTHLTKLLFTLAGAVLIAILFTIFSFQVAPKASPPKIGFILLGDRFEDGWNAAQYQGIRAACETLQVPLEVRDKVEDHSGRCPEEIRQLVAEGCTMIFLCSYAYADEVAEVVESYPHIAFATISSKKSAPNLTSHYIRIYQGRFLTGALAGLQTQSGTIGYIAAFPNAETIQGINAFALGLRLTNPQARVLVFWTNSWNNPNKEAEHTKQLILGEHADVIAYHQDGMTVPQIAEQAGIPFIGYNSTLTQTMNYGLTSILCRWDLYYNDIIQRFMKGELNSVKNHWLGIEQGIVRLSPYSQLVAPDVRTQVDSIKDSLFDNRLVFKGPIYDNTGKLRCKTGEALSDATLLEDFDWFVEGVEILN